MILIPFFLIPLLIATATLLPPGETIVTDDEANLEPDETLDFSQNIETVTETTETIGDVDVDLTQEVKIVATQGDSITITNVELATVIVEIPDDTTISGPDSWNGEITPPISVSTSGSVSGNFLTPSTSISIGSPDVILVFDDAVTILLEETTGQTAYKTPGSNTWILISGCTGTYAAPDNPPVNGECSISNGVDTKILTFHFTEFTELDEIPTEDPVDTPSTGTSSGHGNTNVGSPRIFGSSGGYHSPTPSGQLVFPVWFDDVTDWYREGKISSTEFLNSYQWILDNIIK